MINVNVQLDKYINRQLSKKLDNMLLNAKLEKFEHLGKNSVETKEKKFTWKEML